MSGGEWLYLGIALLVSLLLTVAGYRYFCAKKWALAERG